uniref:Tyrosine-protein kinase receptor n=1 Tax=Pyrrhocoris apterus TaxID=37000 RepID=A0A6H0DXL8_PYRAP|nr:insulin receptor 1a [Pyrrhocoris apterus]
MDRNITFGIWYLICGIICIASFILQTNGHLRTTDITIRKERGICQSTDIRNSVRSFSQLEGCQVVEGFVQIVLIDNANETDYANISFPELKEITGFLLLYRVSGLRSLGKIFPNLSVIRGNTLFLNYALVVFEMLHLQEIGLVSLTDILRGAVAFAKNPMLCYVDTVDWDAIAANAKGDHYMAVNKLPDECPMCPTSNHSCPISEKTRKSLCWNSQNCQIICPSYCNGTCNLNGECCPPSCLGGCTGTPNFYQCLSCRYFQFQNKCVKNCPNGTYEYLNRRCILDSECYDMPKPWEISDSNIRNNPWKPFRGKCLLECPTNYLEKFNTSIQKYTCEACGDFCKKECRAANVDSIAAAQELRGCTIIRGALEIQIRGGSHFVKELEENLNMIEEIDDYLKIVRSFPIVSLNFLKNLRIIHGKSLDNSKYALVVLDNENLVELWDWSTREKKPFRIGNGKLFFHFNPKLCLSKIEKLKEVAGLPDFTELEVASNSNGDKVACHIKNLNVTVYKKNSHAALIKWNQFEHYDSRTLLGYVVYSIEAPYRNVTMYDRRDACGDDGWRVDDVSASEKSTELNHILTRLKPFTQYAFYVKTYTIATETSGAQSSIQYFTTDPYIPTEPRSLSAFSNSSSELVISWQPPAYPNGNLTHYIITGYWERDSKEFIEQRDYCSEPITPPGKRTESTFSKPKKFEDKKIVDEELETCSCKPKVPPEDKQREKEIYLEDHLQNQIYVKRFNLREKREVTNEDKEFPSNPEERITSHSFVDGTQFTKIISGTSLVVKNLRHFALYNVAVRACRKWEPDEKIVENENCSAEAITSVRTWRLVTADNIDSQYPLWEISNKTLGRVTLKWSEPPQPNSLIVTYEIEYKRLDIENYKPTVECITQKHFSESGYVYHLNNLSPGNYSLRVRAASLAGKGDYTPYKYFVIEESSFSILFIILIVMLVIFIIFSFVGMFFYFLKRQYIQVPNSKLFATVNPDYVPTVYEPDDWEVPRNRVELLGEIGQGSFGMVYEGRLYSLDGSSEQLCAVKTVNVQAADRDRIEFLNEASVMKAFSTHHVVKLLGVVSQGQPTFVIMELMKLGDLKSYLRSHRPDPCDNPRANPPSLKRILRMTAEIADGMAYLAAKKFVHRDLAARNCMVAEDLTVKIGDFGMTRDIYETEYYRKKSKGLLPVRWMAPESLKDGVFTSYSDVWSYGVVLYEMSTLASQPYQGLSNDQVLRYVIDGGIMEKPENCPNKLYSIMRLCWEHKPSSRPSFIKLVTLLQNYVDADFQDVSFYHSDEGVEYRAQMSSEETQLIISREIEDFSLSDDEDFKEPCLNKNNKINNENSTPNGYVSDRIVTTKC